MLQNIVASPGVDLAEVVIRALRERQLFRRFHPSHLGRTGPLTSSKLAFGSTSVMRFQATDGRGGAQADLLVAEPAACDPAERPLDQVHRRARDHLPLIGVAACGVRIVVIVVRFGRPPAPDYLEVEPGVKTSRTASSLVGMKHEKGRSVVVWKQPRVIDDVPAVSDPDTVEDPRSPSFFPANRLTVF